MTESDKPAHESEEGQLIGEAVETILEYAHKYSTRGDETDVIEDIALPTVAIDEAKNEKWYELMQRNLDVYGEVFEQVRLWGGPLFDLSTGMTMPLPYKRTFFVADSEDALVFYQGIELSDMGAPVVIKARLHGGGAKQVIGSRIELYNPASPHYDPEPWNDPASGVYDPEPWNDPTSPHYDPDPYPTRED